MCNATLFRWLLQGKQVRRKEHLLEVRVLLNALVIKHLHLATDSEMKAIEGLDAEIKE